MNTVTFTNKGSKEWAASTGELIGFYPGTELWGRGSTGWYITEVNGDFGGYKFNSLADAKEYLIRKYNHEQYVELVLEKTAKTIAKFSTVGA